MSSDLAAPLTGLFLVVLARLAPILVAVPFFGGRWLPGYVRLAGAAAAAAFVTLAHAQPGGPLWSAGAAFADRPHWQQVLVLGREAAIGAVIAFVAAVPFHAAAAAGDLIETSRGTRAGSLLAATASERMVPMSRFLQLLALVVFVGIDGHLLFVRALVFSYEAVPAAGSAPVSGAGAAALVAALIDSSAGLVATAVGLAAPVLVTVFLVDLMLGLMNRASPQLPGYFFGMPAKAALSTLILMLALAATAVALAGEGRALSRALENLGS